MDARHQEAARVVARMENPPRRHRQGVHLIAFQPKDPHRLSWRIPVPADNSGTAVAQAAEELRYFYAQNPAEFYPPTWEGIQ